MRATITGPDHEDGHLIVSELHDWLVGDAELRRSARIHRVTRESAGTMGALDVIEVVLGQGIAAANLALAYASWRSTRPVPPRVRVTLPGGTLTLTDDSPEALERILAALREPPPGAPAGTTGARDADSARAEAGGDGAA
ncbi:effector-associated constant component EACC1 [Streptomyces arenae]|uniref:effector-associated constant component EACC1 n=1 Tax=Streptomyces arenae TaxID=29301 RepID=UPI002659007F|nr:hypothetical protein [Streptomyces arenae]MCG7204041.1 hypothetical protein [Streptomyces arenae]